MKWAIFLLSSLLAASCAKGKENTFTGSTPADPVIRSFLGIRASDSIDFIRWVLVIADDRYQLECNYGIGKPNTNKFIDGGEKIKFSGQYKKENAFYLFQNGPEILKAVKLNEDLLHLVKPDNSLLVGNGGWSYTLNNISPSGSSQVNFTGKPIVFVDSMSFIGRTPCNIPGLTSSGNECYKIKWSVVFYAEAKGAKEGSYKIRGTQWRTNGGRTGPWKIVKSENGQTVYQLKDENGDRALYLLKLDDQILVFTDAQGKLLVGNEDFSYTLNRQW